MALMDEQADTDALYTRAPGDRQPQHGGTPSSDGRLEYTRLAHVFDQTPTAALVNVSLSAMIAWALHTHAPSAPLATWLAGIVAVTVVRLLQLRRFRRDDTPDVAAWTRRYIVTMAASGLLWGASLPLFLPVVPSLHGSLLVIALAGLAAGALPIHAAVLRIYCTFLASVLVPCALTYFWLGEPAHLLLAGMTTLYSSALVLAARNYSRALHDAYRLSAELEAANEQLAHQASHDGLTGLYNRGRFETAFDRELDRTDRYRSHFALIMLDIDNFKQINDRHGHEAGDRVLRALGALFRQEIRAPDVAARWGGEEFMILLPETRLPDARAVAERLRARIAHARLGEPEGVTASLGVTECRGPETHGASLRRLDEALYRSKRDGRNRVTAIGPSSAWASA